MEIVYEVFYAKKDKRYKKGFNPKTFRYVDVGRSLDTLEEAKKVANSIKNPNLVIGIETITKYI